jgi:hypothetical protein
MSVKSTSSTVSCRKDTLRLLALSARHSSNPVTLPERQIDIYPIPYTIPHTVLYPIPFLGQDEELRERDMRGQLEALVAARQLVGNAIFSLEVGRSTQRLCRWASPNP